MESEVPPETSSLGWRINRSFLNLSHRSAFEDRQSSHATAGANLHLMAHTDTTVNTKVSPLKMATECTLISKFQLIMCGGFLFVFR